MLIPIITVILNIHHLFTSLGQSPLTVKYMNIYVQTYIPALVLYAMNDIQKRFLNSIGETRLTMIALLCATILHVPWILLLTQHYHFGVEGICYAGIITQFTSLVLLLLISYCNKNVSEYLYWPDGTTFQGLRVQVSIALNSLAMDIFDWWYYDSMIFIAGFYGSHQQAAQIAIMNVASFFYRSAIGIAIASSTLVGNSIGSGEVEVAKKKCRVIQ